MTDAEEKKSQISADSGLSVTSGSQVCYVNLLMLSFVKKKKFGKYQLCFLSHFYCVLNKQKNNITVQHTEVLVAHTTSRPETDLQFHQFISLHYYYANVSAFWPSPEFVVLATCISKCGFLNFKNC